MGWIYFDHSPIFVDDESVNSWFPELTPWGAIAGSQLVDQIDDRISVYNQTNIASSTIERALEDLFQTFKPYQFGSKTEKILAKLRTLLGRDMYGVPRGGLKTCRQRSLILACLARCTRSYALAHSYPRISTTCFITKQPTIYANGVWR
jgi:hypothetical protein